MTGPLESLVVTAEADFVRRLGRPPRWIVAAPGRVNLIGEHTDYNDGFVLPMAIERHVVIAADRPLGEAALGVGAAAKIFSAAEDQWAAVAVEGLPTPGFVRWANYIQGVIAGCLSAGIRPGPFEGVIHSDVPLGGGLSSSAALEVASATLLEAIAGKRLEPLAKALLCQKAEHDFAGVPCGIMDQCSSVFGRAGSLLLLDCRACTVRWTPLADPDAIALIANSNVKHELAAGAYAARRRECERAARTLGVAALRDVTTAGLEQCRDRLDDVLYRRARHVVSEIARTVDAAEAIRDGDWERVGRLMYASHQSLRDDFEVSCTELDVLVAAAQSLGPGGGVIGSRMTGGGFGGCTISLVRWNQHEEVARYIREAYRQATGREATTFVTRPVDGAHVIKGA